MQTTDLRYPHFAPTLRWFSGKGREQADWALRTLSDALADGRATDSSRPTCMFRLKGDRVPHLRAFLHALAEVGRAARDLGREEGHSALLRLARGEVTVDDYEIRRKK